jgi:pyridoxal 5'-phosphate synthase pdxT subunit
MHIGVLALQGDFAEHAAMVAAIGQTPVEVRLPRDLAQVDAFIMPGGESTTFGKLAVRWGMIEPIRDFIRAGKPVWGTCAGLIFLAKDVGRDQPTLGMMDIVVKRNAFGRQVDSFSTPLDVNGMPGGPFPGVFIRAPLIASTGTGVETLCTLDNGVIVAARQGNMLATSFHPELTRDTRMHALFASLLQSEPHGPAV